MIFEKTSVANPTSADYAALILRVGFGALILAHGLIKLFVFTLAGAAGFFESVGMPGWAAYPVTFGEIAAGLALIAGVAVRAAALALVPILLGALVVHLPAGFLFSNPNGGWEFPAFLVLVAVVQAVLGAGAYAVKLGAPTRNATAEA
ncbi:MAG: DoxX family protein [Pseudomonadota bacterium]